MTSDSSAGAGDDGLLRSVKSGPVPQRESLGAIERTVSVLGLLADSTQPTLGVTEIARELGLPKAVVHRTLASLRVYDFVDFEESTRRYRLGPGVLRLGSAYLNSLDVRDLAKEAMEDLAQKLEETATLSVRSGWSRIYIHQVLPQTDVRMVVEIGRPFPLHAGSSSKAFLAFLPQREIDEYLSRPLESITPDTVTDPGALATELRQIREAGFASSRGERQAGAASIAAPIRDVEGTAIAVLSVCGPMQRFDRKRKSAIPQLVAAARSISYRFGYKPRDSEL